MELTAARDQFIDNKVNGGTIQLGGHHEQKTYNIREAYFIIRDELNLHTKITPDDGIFRAVKDVECSCGQDRRTVHRRDSGKAYGNGHQETQGGRHVGKNIGHPINDNVFVASNRNSTGDTTTVRYCLSSKSSSKPRIQKMVKWDTIGIRNIDLRITASETIAKSAAEGGHVSKVNEYWSGLSDVEKYSHLKLEDQQLVHVLGQDLIAYGVQGWRFLQAWHEDLKHNRQLGSIVHIVDYHFASRPDAQKPSTLELYLVSWQDSSGLTPVIALRCDSIRQSRTACEFFGSADVMSFGLPKDYLIGYCQETTVKPRVSDDRFADLDIDVLTDAEQDKLVDRIATAYKEKYSKKKA